MSKAGSHDVHRKYPIAPVPKFNAVIEPRRSYKHEGNPLAPPWMKPVLALNQEYIMAGAADDKDTPLCWGIPRLKPCKNMALPGGEFCQDCEDDHAQDTD